MNRVCENTKYTNLFGMQSWGLGDIFADAHSFFTTVMFIFASFSNWETFLVLNTFHLTVGFLDINFG